MATVVSICNMALARIGVSSFISNLNEASNEARVLNLFYEQMRDFALRDNDWNFARRRVVLANAGTPPTNWAFKYTYPSDCIYARKILMAGMRNPRNDQRIPFEIASEGSQRVIYTDQAQAELVYTARITDPTLYDPMFESALAFLLAAEVAMPLTVKESVANAARNGYERVKSLAAAQSANEGFEGAEPESQLITERVGSSAQITVFNQDDQ